MPSYYEYLILYDKDSYVKWERQYAHLRDRNGRNLDDMLSEVLVLPVLSDPTMKDSDGDGISDYIERTQNVIDERYDTEKATIDIDDFYYEITNDNVLSISIDVLVDKLEEKLMEESIKIEEEKVGEDKIEKDEERNIDVKEKITTLFNTDDNDTYVTYNVCIVRENDTVDSILEKYGITHDQLEKYNDLTDIKIGDKLLIPSEDE